MKKVLITGGSRGIGKAVAKKYLESGYFVIINCNKSIDELNETVKEFKLISENVVGIVSDVSDYEQTKFMFDKIRNLYGEIDILVNNAAISYNGIFHLMKIEEIDSVIKTNLNSVIYTSHCVLPYMINRKNGCIINISSIWGVNGASCEAVYSATKGGINSFTKALGKELAPSNIKVNAIACGVIDTKMNDNLTLEERQLLCDDIPLNRFGESNEVAELCFYLSSDKSNYIVGQTIIIDGGLI